MRLFYAEIAAVDACDQRMRLRRLRSKKDTICGKRMRAIYLCYKFDVSTCMFKTCLSISVNVIEIKKYIIIFL